MTDPGFPGWSDLIAGLVLAAASLFGWRVYRNDRQCDRSNDGREDREP